MGEYTVHLVGESKYQKAIRDLREGQTIELVPEPKNRFDKRAIKAVSRSGETVGYIERNSWVTGAILDQKADVFARVKRIIGGSGQSKGVVLILWTAADAIEARNRPDPQPPAGCIGIAALGLMAGLGLAALMLPGKAQADDGFATARARNAAYCRSIGQGKACIDRQNREMAHFVTMLAGFKLSKAEAGSCMARGKRGRFVDWTVATPCLRQKVKGRQIGG